MSHEFLINMTPHETRVALLIDGKLHDFFLERNEHKSLVNAIYKGKITRILPGIKAIFVDIGLPKAAFLYIGESGENLSQIKDGQEILVQVIKDPLGTKGARLTTQLRIPARFLVLTGTSNQITVSQKIHDEAERNRLMSSIEPHAQYGFVFRTAAKEKSIDIIHSEKKHLERAWQDIQEKAKNAKVGEKIYEDDSLNLRVIRDYPYTINKILIDNNEGYEALKKYTDVYDPNVAANLLLYTELRPLFDKFQIEDEIQKALQRRVNLKSGGYIIFDETEAMSTIDVNTGSFLGKRDPEETMYKTNLEAVDVIAHQIRLRNLGGIIIIDFIDMENLGNKEKVLHRLEKALAKDSTRVQISEVSRLGLVQITRKRTRKSLQHLLCETCISCQGRGTLKSIETVAYEIIRDIQRTLDLFSCQQLLLRASQPVIQYLQDKKLIDDIAKQLDKTIQTQIESFLRLDEFSVLPLT